MDLSALIHENYDSLKLGIPKEACFGCYKDWEIPDVTVLTWWVSCAQYLWVNTVNCSGFVKCSICLSLRRVTVCFVLFKTITDIFEFTSTILSFDWFIYFCSGVQLLDCRVSVCLNFWEIPKLSSKVAILFWIHIVMREIFCYTSWSVFGVVSVSDFNLSDRFLVFCFALSSVKKICKFQVYSIMFSIYIYYRVIAPQVYIPPSP